MSRLLFDFNVQTFKSKGVKHSVAESENAPLQTLKT
jgi:hypothetical protein